MADEMYEPETEPPHVDFLRRMAEIDDAYERGLEVSGGAEVLDFEAARARRAR